MEGAVFAFTLHAIAMARRLAGRRNHKATLATRVAGSSGETIMRISSKIGTAGSLAALVVGLGLLAAPALADGNGSGAIDSFPTEGVMRLGMSPSAPPMQKFNAYFQPGLGSGYNPALGPTTGSCAPVITRHQNNDTIDYPAGC